MLQLNVVQAIPFQRCGLQFLLMCQSLYLLIVLGYASLLVVAGGGIGHKRVFLDQN